MKIEIERTKKGRPALWENGGGYTNTGVSQIIANADGSPKKPIYIRQRGSLANDDHALFIIAPGDLVILADHHRGDFRVFVTKIVAIGDEEAEAETLYLFSMGEWNEEPPEYILPAIEAAQEKATCYHCRRPHYISD
ncbi:hypothetical protein ACTHHL_04400 [Aeribacillus composti]|uniref:hypothetical protein n=1 Tax=Aeribacillus composti TaxID=1868734 RepID=UPI00406A5FDF